jgi:hypothetical protein
MKDIARQKCRASPDDFCRLIDHWRMDNQTNILSHAELLGTLERAVKKHPHTVFVPAMAPSLPCFWNRHEAPPWTPHWK